MYAVTCSVTTVCMIVFYIKYQEDLSCPWGVDSTIIIIIYVIIMFLTLWYQTYLSKQAANELAKSNEEKEKANEHTSELLEKIKITVESLIKATQVMSNNLKDKIFNDFQKSIKSLW